MFSIRIHFMNASMNFKRPKCAIRIQSNFSKSLGPKVLYFPLGVRCMATYFLAGGLCTAFFASIIYKNNCN